MSGFVYILKDEKGKFYIGSTSDVNRRLQAHQKGYTQTTRHMKNLELVLSQKYSTLDIARKIERKIKKLKRKDYIEKMIHESVINGIKPQGKPYTQDELEDSRFPAPKGLGIQPFVSTSTRVSCPKRARHHSLVEIKIKE